MERSPRSGWTTPGFRGRLRRPVTGVEGTTLEAGIIYPMNVEYHAALVAAGVHSTYQVHPGGHDLPDFADELRALLAWGPFKPVVLEPNAWTNQTVATSGQVWDIGYRFATPPDAVVTFRQSGRAVSVSGAGSSLTLTTPGRCTLHLETPAAVTLQRHCLRRGTR